MTDSLTRNENKSVLIKDNVIRLHHSKTKIRLNQMWI
jgi:hypothetical protein